MNDWGEIISVFLLSTVKFVLGSVPLALGFGFSFLKSLLVTTAGGFLGVFIFVNTSEYILNRWQERKKTKKKITPFKKNFTRKNKLIVRTKRRFGLTGIALLTPLLLSIPIGSFIALRYFKNKHKVLVYLFGSVIFWSASSYYLYKPLFDAIQNYFF
ncbi:MAG: hypothetical protein IPP32_13250 [Bacteroidetes bacterium]|nr:hypothetical protein [Bacteroidota bacterium]